MLGTGSLLFTERSSNIFLKWGSRGFKTTGSNTLSIANGSREIRQMYFWHIAGYANVRSKAMGESAVRSYSAGKITC